MAVQIITVSRAPVRRKDVASRATSLYQTARRWRYACSSRRDIGRAMAGHAEIASAETTARSGHGLQSDVEIILDLSRLLSRSLHAMPTGIDRVELAYARTLLDLIPGQLRFAAVNPFGLYGRLPHKEVVNFLDDTEARWARRDAPGRSEMLAGAARTLLRLRPRRVPSSEGKRRFYLQASPHHLDRPGQVRAKLRAECARFVCLVHDLIPIEFPEYARPNGADTHRIRMRTMAELADGLITNSEATAGSLRRYLGDMPRPPQIRVAHLGNDPLPDGVGDVPPIATPYFVVLSTIEPRKNHMLLLNIWRRMVEIYGPERTPHLAVVGRRGWENENVIDMLERCDAIRGHVHEFSGLPDRSVGALLRSARALLCPSFAEGFGMPVAEALQSGTPVICSDLPALREAGGTVPDFIDPLDGPEWIRTIMDFSPEPSPMRERQLIRLGDWSPPAWRTHLDTVIALVRDLDAGAERRV